MTFFGALPSSILDTFQRHSRRLGIFLTRILGHIDGPAQLPVNLHADGHAVIDQQRRIDLRPGSQADEVILTSCAHSSCARWGIIDSKARIKCRHCPAAPPPHWAAQRLTEIVGEFV